MISPNELRLGNWVEYKIHGKDEWVAAPVFGLNMDSGKNFRPILLTTEILERCSFFGRTEINEQDSFFNGDDILIRVSDMTFWLHNEVDGSVWGLCDQRSIIYLHHLQNLYFALTGEELQIEL